MDIDIIEQLKKINNDEIKLLNDVNDKVLKEEYEFIDVIKISKFERFIQSEIKKKKYAEIVYMLVGTSRHHIDDEIITLKQGELLFLNKYVQHKVDRLAETDVAIRICIKDEFAEKCVFENDYLINFFMNTLFEENVNMSFIRMDIESITPVKNILENMVYSMLYKENIDKQTNILYLNLLFEHLKNAHNKLKFSSNAKDVRNVIMVIKYIDENLRDGELKDIADTLAINPYTLSKTIKRMTGYNFKELLQVKKLDTALYLLSNTNMPITKIADTIGYENTSYFHKIFKAKYNVSPKKYRD